MRRALNSSVCLRVVSMALLLGFFIAAIGGCASRREGIEGVSGKDADNLNAGRGKFDSSEDPPFTAETHYAAGRLAETQMALGGAIEQYKAALKIDAGHQKSLYRLGIVQTQLKQYPAAIETWKRYIKSTNDSPTALSNLGFCYELSGDLEDAEATYQHGIELDSKSTACRVNYGLMLARKNRISAATMQLSAVLSEAEVHYNLASVLEQQGRKEEAKAEYAKAIAADPSMRDARMRLADLK